MRARTWVAAALAAATAGGSAGRPARAQDNPNPDQLRKMYDDALGQLKAAQDRKNQLAAENEKLGQQVEALRKDLAAAAARADELSRADADHAERTYYLRAHQAAWRDFVRASPEVAARWRAFVGNGYLLNPREFGTAVDRDWPAATGADLLPPPATLIPAGTTRPAASTQPASTQPTTIPSTQPEAGRPATTAAATLPTAAGGPPATSPAVAATLPATRPSTPPTIPSVQPALAPGPATVPATVVTSPVPSTQPATVATTRPDRQ